MSNQDPINQENLDFERTFSSKQDRDREKRFSRSHSDSRSRSRSNEKSPSRRRNEVSPKRKSLEKSPSRDSRFRCLKNGIKFDNELLFQKIERKALPLKSKDQEEEFELEDIDENEHKNKESVKMIDLKLVAKKVQDPRRRLFERLGTKEKLNLIVDLDETLLNSVGVSWTFDESTLTHIPPQFIKEIQNEGDGMRVIVVLRPYYKQFLERLTQYYNIYAYSHGRWDYVEKVLNIIDEDKIYINRDTIFKNLGQVGKSTPKNISGLGLVNKEADKTVILDDQKYIWEVAAKKVLPSKKFIPLKDHMHEEKYLRYMLIERKNEPGIWQLNHKEDPFGLKLYAEFSMIDRKSSQLEHLANFLEDLYIDYNLHNISYPAGHEKLKVNKIIEDKIGKIIKGWKVTIVSVSESRIRMFQELAETLGANVVNLKDAVYILADAEVNKSQVREIREKVENSPLVTVISADWLVECFFAVTRVSIQNFKREEFD